MFIYHNLAFVKQSICTYSALYNVRIYFKRSKSLYNKLCRTCYRLIYSGICTYPKIQLKKEGIKWDLYNLTSAVV
nr:MAG TPA: cytochrome C6 [Caudoviricetes sp.]